MSGNMRWVYVQEVRGWVREHDPRTESGIAPAAMIGMDPENDDGIWTMTGAEFRAELAKAWEGGAVHAARTLANQKPRTISTYEELAALTNGATIKSLIGGKPTGRTWGKVEGEWWGLALEGIESPSLPALLIHEPEVADK